MWPLIATGIAVGVLAHGARGRSSQLFAPSVYRGPRHRRALALTFDDGPSPSTPRLLSVLEEYGVRATFFVCGANVRQRPEILREVVARGHEIGNHTETHARLWLRSPSFIEDEVGRGQQSIGEAVGVTPVLFRAPYGVRWFGLRDVQRRYGLTGVMWTVIGRDWACDAATVATRITTRASNGGIICLHDGRELNPEPDIENTIAAVRSALPVLLERGYRFETVSDLLCPTT